MDGIKKDLDAAVKAASTKYKHMKKQNKKLERENKELVVTDLAIISCNLRKMNIYYEMIEPAMCVPDTVLAGGFVLQCVVGESWNTDLDIVTEHPHKVIQSLTYLNTVDEIPHKEVYNNCMKGIKTLYRGTFSNGVRVDIIHVNNVADAINSFDLDFCKCTFDGRRITLLNPWSVINKVHNLKNAKPSKVPPHMRHARICKYMRRGFRILNEDGTPLAVEEYEAKFSLVPNPEKNSIEEVSEESPNVPLENSDSDDTDVAQGGMW